MQTEETGRGTALAAVAVLVLVQALAFFAAS
jgi:hypothetical protein